MDLGNVKTKVAIQEKPVELSVAGKNLKVGVRVPAFLTLCGTILALVTFELLAFGVNLQEAIFAYAGLLGAEFVAILMIAGGAILLLKGSKPIKTLLPLSLD